MKVTFVKNFQELSELGAYQVVEQLNDQLDIKDKVVFLPSAGKTPTLLYSLLVDKYKDQVDWRRVYVFQMDEYLNIPIGHPGSFATYLYKNLIRPLSINQYFFLDEIDGSEIEKHEGFIERLGGIDLALHGIGTNGHIGFNEPGSCINSKIRVVTLNESTKISNQNDHFLSMIDVPDSAVTLGLDMLKKSKRNILLAAGESKHAAVSGLISSEKFSADLPASALVESAHLHVITDAIDGNFK